MRAREMEEKGKKREKGRKRSEKNRKRRENSQKEKDRDEMRGKPKTNSEQNPKYEGDTVEAKAV